MEIKGSVQDGIINLVINGKLDMNNALTAEQYFLKYAESGNKFVLDFSDVVYITSAGIRALLTLYRAVSEIGGYVTIKNPQETVVEVLNETAFADLFNIEK